MGDHRYKESLEVERQLQESLTVSDDAATMLFEVQAAVEEAHLGVQTHLQMAEDAQMHMSVQKSKLEDWRNGFLAHSSIELMKCHSKLRQWLYDTIEAVNQQYLDTCKVPAQQQDPPIQERFFGCSVLEDKFREDINHHDIWWDREVGA